ncbi:MAG: transglutaminaseTgpA domain-containing protein [Actinomycetota bacterium]
MDRSGNRAAGRLLELTGLVVLVASAGAALGRLFRAGAATPRILVVGIAALFAAAAVWRLRGGLAVPATLLLLAWLVAGLVAPGTLREGLPTGASLDALGGAILAALERSRSEIAPVAASRPFLAAALAATGAAAVAAHALLVRARRPLLAALPPLLLAGSADLSLGNAPSRWITAGLVAGVLGVLLGRGVDRLVAYGRPVPPLSSLGAVRVATRGARIPALAVAAIAILLPGVVPGPGSEPLLDLAGGAPPVTRLEPFVSIRAQLLREDRAELLRIRTPGGQAAYWRLFALDRFDGATWSASPAALSEPPGLTSPASLPFAEGLVAPFVRQDVELLAPVASEGWLPMAYPAREVRFGEGLLRYDAASGTALLDRTLRPGDTYSVTSLRVSPRASDLEDIRFDPPWAYGPYTELPVDRPPILARIARGWTSGEETPYRKILAIQEHLLDGSFRYSIDAGGGTGPNALVRFLTRTRTGFCQQFSTAMAALVRELGYPARVAVGFRQGQRDGDTYTVTNLDAHSWVEVFFPRYGWLAFEPTPGRPNPVGDRGSYLDPIDPVEALASEPGAGADRPDACLAEDGSELPPQLCRATPDIVAPDPPGAGAVPPVRAARPAPERGSPIASTVAGLLAAIAAGVPLAKSAARRRRLGRARSPRRRALAAFDVVAATARDLGRARTPQETFAEFAARIASERPDLNAELRRLVASAELAA